MADIAIRDREGHFLPGTKAGPGNPHVKTVMQLRRKLFEYADSNDVVNELLTAALNLLKDPKSKHHADAIKFWGQYLFGKPDQHMSLDVTSDNRTQTISTTLSPDQLDVLRRAREILSPPQNELPPLESHQIASEPL